MRVLLYVTGPDAADWHGALAAALPEARITLWPEGASDADYVVVWKAPAEVLADIPRARAIFNLGAGVDALMKLPTLPASLPIFRLEDAGMADQMIDYVTLAVLGAYRQQRLYAEQQRERRWQRHAFRSKQDMRVGMLGFGLLGQAVAAGLARHGFPIAGWSRQKKPTRDVLSFGGLEGLTEFLTLAQVLVCMLPSTAETRGLMNRTRFSQLPRGAHFINVARGDIVVDADLIDALDEGQLASATLDVFHEEPLPSSHPFWHHPRIAITPHSSAITLIGDSVAQVAAKIRQFDRGQPVTGIVDRARGY